jgi:hypothetical protein
MRNHGVARFADYRTGMKLLFRIFAALTLVLGLAWLFLPEAMLESWGVHGDELTVHMSRRLVLTGESVAAAGSSTYKGEQAPLPPAAATI